ncbi:MAG: CYTH domain-containing protein [Bacteroidetes bacterium]|nr:CYTH domain-containing protein [Bacteroidota bacterium]
MDYHVPYEIERKFLVKNAHLPDLDKGVQISQGYLYAGTEKTIRLRIKEQQGFITIKGPSDKGARPEFEYAIPFMDAQFMLENYCREGRIEKIRREIAWAGKTWEIDEFLGENNGLWIAEVELLTQDEDVELPPWIGAEVTGDNRYHNSSLSVHPYTHWEL